jgi:hypothetical protein
VAARKKKEPLVQAPKEVAEKTITKLEATPVIENAPIVSAPIKKIEPLEDFPTKKTEVTNISKPKPEQVELDSLVEEDEKLIKQVEAAVMEAVVPHIEVIAEGVWHPANSKTLTTLEVENLRYCKISGHPDHFSQIMIDDRVAAQVEPFGNVIPMSGFKVIDERESKGILTIEKI